MNEWMTDLFLKILSGAGIILEEVFSKWFLCRLTNADMGWMKQTILHSHGVRDISEKNQKILALMGFTF